MALSNVGRLCHTKTRSHFVGRGSGRVLSLNTRWQFATASISANAGSNGFVVSAIDFAEPRW